MRIRLFKALYGCLLAPCKPGKNGASNGPSDTKLFRLHDLLRKMQGGLWCYGLFIVGVTVIFGFWIVDGFSEADFQYRLTFVGTALLAAVGFFGHFFAKYADFQKQLIDNEISSARETENRKKRLIAFHAEISVNLSETAEYYSESNRKKLIDSILKHPNQDKFGKSDDSNPIFEENSAYLYEFSRPTIEAIIDYYNLDKNLNAAIDALTDPGFKKLSETQKLSWHRGTLQLVEKVIVSGGAALKAIEIELGKSRDGESELKFWLNIKPKPKQEKANWEPIDKEALSDLDTRIHELDAIQNKAAPSNYVEPKRSAELDQP
jgi:hypothetical protein